MSMDLKEKIIIFTGPSLGHEEASKILDADYRPPVARGDVHNALGADVKIIGIIDGVFHQQPAVGHKEILEALKKKVIVVGGASMGALRASELDIFGMVGVGTVYNDYKNGIIESDDDVAVVINPETLEQLSEALVSMDHNFKNALNNGIINDEDYNILITTSKSIYYPKRTYNKVFKESGLDSGKIRNLQKYLESNKTDIKKEDAINVLKYIKKIIKVT